MFGSLYPDWYIPHVHTSSCYKWVQARPCNGVINAHTHTDACKNGCPGNLNSHNCQRAGCIKRILICGYKQKKREFFSLFFYYSNVIDTWHFLHVHREPSSLLPSTPALTYTLEQPDIWAVADPLQFISHEQVYASFVGEEAVGLTVIL